MNIDAVKIAESGQSRVNNHFENMKQQKKWNEGAASSEQVEKKDVQPEELIQQIKALTEDGLYSVRFENDAEAKELVVKVVDNKTDEVIRQIPPEELLHLTERLNDLRGNIVNTEG